MSIKDDMSSIVYRVHLKCKEYLTWSSVDIVTQHFRQDRVGGGTKKIHAPIHAGFGASVAVENRHPWLAGIKMLLL